MKNVHNFKIFYCQCCGTFFHIGRYYTASEWADMMAQKAQAIYEARGTLLTPKDTEGLKNRKDPS
jgi:hypothetical protein